MQDSLKRTAKEFQWLSSSSAVGPNTECYVIPRGNVDMSSLAVVGNPLGLLGTAYKMVGGLHLTCFCDGLSAVVFVDRMLKPVFLGANN